jgi:tRNA(fMet)-specific endonuclease VapC
MIGIDTTVLIDLYKKDPDLIELLSKITESISTTVINSQEIQFGLNPKRKNFRIEKEFYDNLMSNLVIHDFNNVCVNKSSEIYWELYSKGKEIGKFDSMIAGILLINGVNKIITKNKKHFENIKGLKVISY